MPWDTIKVQALGLFWYVVVDSPPVENCPHAQFTGLQYVPAVPLKAQLWLVCDRCGTSALWGLSHPDQSHQSNLGTSRHASGCHGAHPIPWVTGVTQTMFLLCEEGAEQAQGCQSQGTLPVWGGTAAGLFQQLFHGNQGSDSVMGVQGHSIRESLGRTH